MSKFYPLTVSQIRPETRDAVVLSFAVPAGLQQQFIYREGQHLTLRAQIAGEDIRRSYSICSAVQDGQLRVAIKRVQGGVFSNWVHDSLRTGMAIDVMPAMGHFNLPLAAEHEKHYLAFAAGSGITPLLSIIKTTLQTEPRSKFTLVYGNRASSTVMFKEELAALKDSYLQRLNLIYIMSREQQDIDLFNGRISAEKCMNLFDQWIRIDDMDAAFICGPEDMMHAVSTALQQRGMAKEQIKVELFAASIPTHRHVASAKPLPGKSSCVVTIIMDGHHTHFDMEKDKESVLDAALKLGHDMRYSCKGGVCSTCRSKVVEGKVDMDRNYALEDYEVARGFVLTCQSFPVSDTLTLDFDSEN
ncbi:phenylacetate-CoA oxygenase/reductase subunit PaaK [Undibacterium sp. CY18W]|uniref:Phenylacetate-CoA oxygenase/reductase subunit PaaK n=1 Tax=Undibacterium hunanense TaxID=2762292 RepID=A0ABR6ZUH2_9BURK|nr:1,2-phenylacetyl-CoA epoxidase subunit PaaE [Undibacterium hunanense]MBC3919495.1 phenylacetate-CoA oxygenase/reductase subunit PaaK [Undibacterium hunanense]